MLRPELDEKGRPAGAASSISTAIKAATSIIPPNILTHPKAVAPAYAVFVLRLNGNVRRQVYLSLHSAQAALDRATAAGAEAKCMLVELVPVPNAPIYVVGGEDR